MHLTADVALLRQTYSERNVLAQLTAALLRQLGAGDYRIEDDPTFPGRPILTIDTPAGQIAFHLNAEDVRLLDDRKSDSTWDGHAPTAATQRLECLTSMFAAWQQPMRCLAGRPGMADI